MLLGGLLFDTHIRKLLLLLAVRRCIPSHSHCSSSGTQKDTIHGMARLQELLFIMPHTPQSRLGPHNPEQAINHTAQPSIKESIVYTRGTLTTTLDAHTLHTLQLGALGAHGTRTW
jgi:hypothetical protein